MLDTVANHQKAKKKKAYRMWLMGSLTNVLLLMLIQFELDVFFNFAITVAENNCMFA